MDPILITCPNLKIIQQMLAVIIIVLFFVIFWSFPGGLVVKNQPANAGDSGDMGSIPGWEYPWRKKWQPTPIFLPGVSDGQRILEGYSLWVHKELDRTEHTHRHFWILPSVIWNSQVSVISLVLSHHNKDLKRWTLKLSAHHSSWTDHVIVLRSVLRLHVTAQFFWKVHPPGMRE